MSNWVGKNWGMSNNWGMGNNWGSISWPGNSFWVGGSSLIGDLRDKTVIVISTVLHSLDTAVMKVDRVGTLNNTASIIGLSLVEGSTRVVISNSIVVAVGRDLSKIISSIGRSRLAIDWSMSNSNGVSNSDSGGNSMGNSNRTSNGMSDRVGNHTRLG